MAFRENVEGKSAFRSELFVGLNDPPDSIQWKGTTVVDGDVVSFFFSTRLFPSAEPVAHRVGGLSFVLLADDGEPLASRHVQFGRMISGKRIKYFGTWTNERGKGWITIGEGRGPDRTNTETFGGYYKVIATDFLVDREDTIAIWTSLPIRDAYNDITLQLGRRARVEYSPFGVPPSLP